MNSTPSRSVPGPLAPEDWVLDPNVCFLNHGSFGACPRVVLEEQSRLRAELEAEPVLFLHRQMEDRLDAVRARLAPFVGSRNEDLVFVPNATSGVNSVLRSLVFAPGDELLVTDHEYGACRNALDFVAERSGARVVVVKVPFPSKGPDEVLEAVHSGLSERTKLLLVDAITSPTGIVLPTQRITAAMRERGIDTLVDGAHVPGHLPLDLERLGATYFTGNCHKWLCTPKGSAILWVDRRRQEAIRPLSISHGAQQWRSRSDKSRFQIEFDWEGTHDPTAVLSIGWALDFLGGLVPGGIEGLMRANHEKALSARALLCERLNVEAPAPESMIGCLVTLPLPPSDEPLHPRTFVDPLQQRLFDRYRIEVPIVRWPATPRRWVRISAQVYNHEAQYRYLADALAQELGLR